VTGGKSRWGEAERVGTITMHIAHSLLKLLKETVVLKDLHGRD